MPDRDGLRFFEQELELRAVVADGLKPFRQLEMGEVDPPPTADGEVLVFIQRAGKRHLAFIDDEKGLGRLSDFVNRLPAGKLQRGARIEALLQFVGFEVAKNVRVL